MHFLDFIPKEFCYHKVCYNALTKPTLQNPRASTYENKKLQNTNKSERVVNYVEDHVIGMHQAVSVKVLTTIYSKDPVDDRRYCYKSKERI